MTVETSTNRQDYAGDGVTQTFSTSWAFFNSSELTVQVVTAATGGAVTLSEGVGYTVAGGAGVAGTVDLSGGSSPNGAPAATENLVILRSLPLTQTDDLQNNDGSDAEVIEDRLDKLTMMVQQIQEEVDRAVKLDNIETATDALTVLPFARASLYLGFDASKGIIATTGTGSTYAATAWALTLLDDTTAAEGRTTLELAAANDVTFTGLNGQGEVTWSGVISPSISGSVNDWAPTGIAAAAEIRFTATGQHNITGIAAGQTDGREILLTNRGSNDVFIIHASGSSTAANRFDLPRDNDVTFGAGTTLLFRYDGTDSVWRLTGGSGSGAGATGGGSDEIFYLNSQTVASSYTVAATKNAMSAGPITIASGITATLTSGARWVIL